MSAVLLSVAALSLGSAAAAKPFPTFNCTGPIQASLRYNMSARDVPFPLMPEANDDLATAVCCDSQNFAYAEPQHTFDQPDVALFKQLNAQGQTVFYDSVCGTPLFSVPRNRTLDDFKADTTEHGWPSFRQAEILDKGLRVDLASGFVFSSCGTHLGSYLPDDKGPRYCLDLSCVAGNPAKAASLRGRAN